MRQKKIEALTTEGYAAGKVIKAGSIDNEFAPGVADQDILLVKTSNDYRMIPLKKDIKRVYIEVSTKCNFACITCIRSSWEDCLDHMSMTTWENLLDQLKELKDLESVHFGGFGEPMMHPQIFEMLSKVKSLGLKVEMITNGSYLTEENIRRLINLQLDILFTSIDSPEEEDYNLIRPGADFVDVSANVVNLQKIKKELQVKKPELGIEFVAMKKNFHQLPQLIDMAIELEANQVIISNLMPYHESMKDQIVYDLDDTLEYFGKETWKTKYFAQVSNMKLRSERLCRFVENKSLCVNSEGDVSPCYPLMHSYDCYVYDRKKKIYPTYYGNVNEGRLADMWVDSGCVNFRRVVQEYNFPSCTDCLYQDGCTYVESNEMDCWGNSPSCGDCLWARRIIACP